MLTFLRTLPVRVVSAYLRNCRSPFARWRLFHFAIRKTREHGPLLGSATIRTHHGFRMGLQLNDWADQHIFATGNYEDYTAKVVNHLLESGDSAVDVGANIGFFTLLMAARVGPSGRVWAFEPSPSTRVRLRRNVELNHFANVTIREEAVSDVDGLSAFFCGRDDHSGVASLRPMPSSGSTYQVRTCRLPNVIPSPSRLRLIKIDIEGAEHLALAGMELLLQKRQPDLIVELSDHFLREMGSSSADVYAFLSVNRYNMYIIDWNGLVKVERWSSEFPTQFNALFTTRQQLPAELRVKLWNRLILLSARDASQKFVANAQQQNDGSRKGPAARTKVAGVHQRVVLTPEFI